MKYAVYLVVVGMIFSVDMLSAQVLQKPDDYLKSEFHEGRREALREKMPDNSVAVFFSNPVRNRANDVDYIYHQDPNFYYFTGHVEPHSLLLIFCQFSQKFNNTSVRNL